MWKLLARPDCALKMPSHPYKLPDPQYTGFKFAENAFERATPREFKTGGELSMKVKVDRIHPNERSRQDADIFDVELSVINLKETTLSILDVKAEWKLKGDSDWQNVESFECMYGSSFACESLQPTKVYLKIIVKDQDKENRGISMFDKSWIARIKPIRFKIMFEDVIGRKGFQIIEYVNPPPYVKDSSSSAKLNVSIDSPDSMMRENLSVSDGDLSNDKVFTVGSIEYDVTEVTRIVYKALKEQKYEYLLKTNTSGDYKWEAYALIDAACQRLYGVKVISQNPYAAALAYYEVPLYSPSEDKELPQLVSELITLPEKSSFQLDDIKDLEMGDDGLGSTVVPPQVTGSGTGEIGTGGTGQLVSVDVLMPVLSSLDNNMKRIADSLEKIVSLLLEKK